MDQITKCSDTAAAACSCAVALPAEAPVNAGNSLMYQRIGELTRKLHDALRELDLDKKIESAAHSSLPDARDRLSYVATLTGQAAERVLCLVEQGQADQAELAGAAAALSGRWSAEGEATADAALVRETRVLLDDIPRRTDVARGQLLEIMMAQDFHDLTGQVISKIGELMCTVETSLLEMLVETRPVELRETPNGLSGPVITHTAETAANQGEVDDLLESLGF